MGHTKRKQNPQLKSRQTRSSRGRLLSLSDPAQTAQQLDDQLKQLGLYAAPTLGDGNCLFRALSDQLYGTDSKHSQLRQDICDWIQKHRSRYEPFVDDERGIDTHLRCMRENATYGGHMELSAFAHMARRNVKVVQPGLVYVIEWGAFATSASPPSPDKEANHPDQDSSPVYVAYHDWEHFSSIRNLKGPHVGLPVVKEHPAPMPDLTPAVAEEYKPAKDKKKVEKERECERKEKKREKAREKLTKGKEKQKSASTNATAHQYQDYDHDQEHSSETETEPEPEPEEGNEPEKLKITLKLRLNSNPSSANISESESKISSPTPTKLAKTGSGLKFRLPPSRSLSATPSATFTTPPASQASSSTFSNTNTSKNSISSSTTINSSTPSATSSTSSSTTTTMTTTSTSANSNSTSTIQHAQPPTYTSAPHLSDESINIDHNGIHRTNRSPKRTFEESEISEDVHSSGSGGGRVRSRLCGPDREPLDSDYMKERLLDKDKSTGKVGDVEMLEADTEAEVEAEEEVKRILSPVGQKEEEMYSDSDISSLSSSPSSPKQKQKSIPILISSPSPPISSPRTTRSSSHHHSSNIKKIQIPNKSSVPAGQGRSNAIRQSKRELALGVAAGMTVNNNIINSDISKSNIINNDQNNNNGISKPLTRRERKKLGLPKVRTVMPYSRGTRTSRIGKSGGGGGGGKGGEEDGDEEEGEKEEEWLRNGTGRVDVRGFRELRI